MKFNLAAVFSTVLIASTLAVPLQEHNKYDAEKMEKVSKFQDVKKLYLKDQEKMEKVSKFQDGKKFSVMHEVTKRDALLSSSNLKENTAAEKSFIREKRDKISELEQGKKISAEKSATREKRDKISELEQGKKISAEK
ncbi:4228_t:CDS:2, partial [Gigaspora margarita]